MSTRVLIIDDSVMVRRALADLLSQHPDIEVVGAVSDGALAMPCVHALQPDVLTLNVEMRKVGGLRFLEQLMRERPVPVILVSGRTTRGAQTALRALSLGAVDFVTRPAGTIREGLAAIAEQLVAKIRLCREIRLNRGRTLPVGAVRPARPARSAQQTRIPLGPAPSRQLILIGASTGGPQALTTVLRAMPANCPPIAVVQHMPESFTTAFAQRLNALCAPQVKEAATGDVLRAGCVLIAPGNRHLELCRSPQGWSAVVHDGNRVSRHRPSVDILFWSALQCAPSRTIAVLLTGMGEDGAQGMLALRNGGAVTIAQNEETCVVFGMPAKAIALGAAEHILPLERIAGFLLHQAVPRLAWAV